MDGAQKITIKGILFLIAILFSSVFITNFVEARPILGVNYYGESLMGRNGINYIPRTASQTASDLDHIKEISNHVKMYMNPFVPENLARIEQILTLARERNMYTVVNMMVDDRSLDNSNWDDYSDRVITLCSQLDGKTDEILVGNEIILRSSLTKTDIKNRVVTLIDGCEQVFSGPVSYEEFWWAHDAWEGYTGRIYLMQYEGLSIFQQNTIKMERTFGSNAIVGEWGEDLLDESIERDENWQRDQIEIRYNILSQTSTPVAYIFTYKEQSWNAFGIVRPNGGERPVWNYLKSLGFGTSTTTNTTTSNTTTNTNPSNTTNTTLPVNTTLPINNTPTYPPINDSNITIVPTIDENATAYVTNVFIADFNAIFVCNTQGFTPTKYSWDFGDGSSDNNRRVSDVYHSFSSNGTYTVTCTASDGTAQAIGGLTVNVYGRGSEPSLIQSVISLGNNNYNLNCEAIGFQPGYCQKITSSNGFEYDWGCTSGSPGYGNLSIHLPNQGEYNLQCIGHLSDSKQLQSYYKEGDTYHVNTCAPQGCILSQNMQFIVSNTNPSNINSSLNVANNTNLSTNISINSTDNTTTNASTNDMNQQSQSSNQSSSSSNRRSSSSRNVATSSQSDNISVLINDTKQTISKTSNVTNITNSNNSNQNNSGINSSGVQSNPNPSNLSQNNLITGLPIKSISSNEINSSNETSQAIFASKFSQPILILLFLLILAALTIIRIANSRDKNFTGDIYPIDEVAGIDPEYKEILKNNSITNTKQLWKSDTEHLADNIGISSNVVKSWQNMAELLSLTHIGPQEAKFLENAGIHNLDQLSKYTPAKLVSKLESVESAQQQQAPGLDIATEWIIAARNHQFGDNVLENERDEQTA